MTHPLADSQTWGWAKTAIGFKPEYLDCSRGIRVGNLEDHQRITRILKAGLEARYRQDFVTERWGRGVFWQWIGFLNRANREAKPKSSDVSFGCSKFFIAMDTDSRRFKCGMQVERGYVRAPREERPLQLRSDWDWHRLVSAIQPRSVTYRELQRLLADEFEVQAGSWSEPRAFRKRLPGADALRRALDDLPAREWCGFQVYFGIDEPDIAAMTGGDLVDTMFAVFEEVRPVMNATMQVQI